jgi:hypothetical protein
MRNTSLAVDHWKEANAHRLIDCRWGCTITSQACRAYQTRTSRYIVHFNGEVEPFPRMNADYVTCFLPEPCPHLLPDAEARGPAENGSGRCGSSDRERRVTALKNRLRRQLVDPDVMLMEEDWRRSLVSR